MSTLMSTDEAMELVYGGHQAIQDVSKHRWYTKQLVVFDPGEGPMLGFYYLNPATEDQEGQDRFEDEPVRVFEVVAREVVTTVYEPA